MASSDFDEPRPVSVGRGRRGQDPEKGGRHMRKEIHYKTANEWAMSLDNPTRAKYTALGLWYEGIRASDRTVIELCYGFSERDTDILCEVLQRMEDVANNILKDYNPDLGF